MFRQKSIVLVVMLCGLICTAAFVNAQSAAEKGQPFLVNYSPKAFDFYPQNWSCVEDKHGLMYFGNVGYILQYDGASWRKIALSTATQSTTRSLINSSDGRIFFGTVGDLGYLAPDSSGTTRCVSLLPYLPMSQRNFYDVWTIYEGDKGIYFQSRDYIFRFTSTIRNSKETWQVKTWPAKAKYLYSFYLDGTYYVHEQNAGLFKMVNDSLVLVPGSEFLGKDRMQVMLPYPLANGKKGYLMGMFYSGIYLYDGEHFTLFKTEADNIIKSALLYKALLLKNGNYALSTTGKGLIIIDRNGKIIQKINRDVGLQDESVYDVYEDTQNNIWLCLDNGISRIETSLPLTQFTVQSGVSSATLLVSRFHGTLYLGTSNGLMRFDSSTRTFREIADLPQTQVFQLLQNGDDLLIPSDGLFSLNAKGLHLIRASIGGDLQAASLLVDNKHPNVLYVGTALGVSVFLRKTKSGQNDWVLLGTIPKIDQQIWTLAQLGDGALWCGTIGSDVYKVEIKFDGNGIPQLANGVTHVFNRSNGLRQGSGPLYMIKHKLYFSSDSAISSFNEQEQRFHIDTTFGTFKNGGGAFQFDMTEDGSGNVWIRAGKVFRLAVPQLDGTYKITDNTGFSPITDGTVNKMYAEKDGTVWACTSDGLIRYNTRLTRENYSQSFTTLVRSISAGSLKLNPVQDSAHGEQLIAYSDNSLRIEYASPFYEQEQKTKYQTWLEGFDKKPSDWWYNNYKEYTNLPEGKYTFHVRAQNVFEKTSEEAVYHFQISAPWYRAWWAYLLYFLILAIVISLFINYRSRALTKQNKMLEENVASRTQQLNESVEELKSTQAQLIQSEKMASLGELTAGIAHEIQNPLNFVNNFSDLNKELIDEMNVEIDNGNLNEVKTLAKDIRSNEEKINSHGRRADAIVKGMLQHSRSRTGIKEATDINALAYEYLRLVNHNIRGKDNAFNVTTKTDFDESIGTINVIPQDIGRVLLNLYNNAFYAVAERRKVEGAGYEPTVSISTKRSGNQVLITVGDNGIGMPQKVIDKIFQPFFTTKPAGQGTGLGLSLSYDIVKAHGGEIKVNTKENEGTEFIVELG